MNSIAFCYLDSPATTSSVTYKMQWQVESSTGVVNQTYNTANANYDGGGTSTISVMET